MPDDTDRSATRAADEKRETREPAPETGPAARPEASDEAGEEDLETLDPKRAAQTIRHLRDVEREVKRERDSAQRELRKLQQKDETDSQRRDRELEDAKASLTKLTERLRREAVRSEVYELAGTLGIANPKLATRLLDYEQLDWGENGEDKPKNLRKLLTDLKSEYPELAGRVAAQARSSEAGTATTGEVTEPDMNERIRQRAGRG